MRKLFVSLAAASMACAFIAADAGAARPGGFGTKLFQYSPAEIAWHAGEGLPDPTGKGSSALHMEIPDGAVQGTRAGAAISGVSGITLRELGFDYRNGDRCSDIDLVAGQLGSPRYKVLIEPTGAEFHFACAAGDALPTPSYEMSWTRVRFTDADAFSRTGDVWPGFGQVVVRKMFILFGGAEDIAPNFTGVVHLDNLDINGYLIGKR